MRYFWWAYLAINICMILIFSPILILEHLGDVPEFLNVIFFIIFLVSLIPFQKK